jgi:hypothetical protein
MTYWRMQLHPSESGAAIKHCVDSLAAGYIGLDFASEVGDLKTTTQSALPKHQKDYWAFADEMVEGDWVLIVAHHYPFALVKVVGPYNYIRDTAPEIGVWFRHFRKIDEIKYYGDFVNNPHSWQQTIMTDTISPLRNADALSMRLIVDWLGTERSPHLAD